jgi:hypothetical protein
MTNLEFEQTGKKLTYFTKEMEDFMSPSMLLSPFLHNPPNYGNIVTLKGIS